MTVNEFYMVSQNLNEQTMSQIQKFKLISELGPLNLT